MSHHKGLMKDNAERVNKMFQYKICFVVYYISNDNYNYFLEFLNSGEIDRRLCRKFDFAVFLVLMV